MLEPLTLSGTRASLEPLQMSHAPDLWRAAQDRQIWTYYPRRVESLDDMESFIAETLDAQKLGVQLPFAIRDLELNQWVGSTRLMDFSAENRGVEIGGAWLSSAVWRTRINTECKFLLLRHGFETLDLLRVFLKTDARNERSQRAIERLGAKREGTLRSHMILPDGFVRDSVYYSVLRAEWPSVKARMAGFLAFSE